MKRLTAARRVKKRATDTFFEEMCIRDRSEVRVGELMNLSGITVKGIAKGTGKEMSVIAYFADKF